MKQIIISKYGPPEVLQVREVTTPEPSANEVRVKIHYAGVNFAEVMARMRLYPGAPKPPTTIGAEGCGIIEKVGNDVTQWQVGAKVMFFARFKSYASHVITSAELLIPLPDSLTIEQGAAFPLVYTTAHLMMFDQGNLRENQTILIQGAGGGVGTAAIQLAKSVGAKTIGTASGWKQEKLIEMGLDHFIDYTKEDVLRKVIEFTDGRGVDVCFDPVGGKSWMNSYKALSELGKLIVFGNQTIVSGFRLNPLVLLKEFLTMTKFSPMKLIPRNKGVMGFHLGYLKKSGDRVKAAFTELLKLADEGKISPVVDTVFPYIDAPGAHRHMQERKNFGKILIDFREAD